MDSESISRLSWTGELSLSPGIVIYTGPGGSAEEHSHHAIQLIRSIGSPFTLEAGGVVVETQAALVPSGLRHSFNCEADVLVIALIEPTGPRGAELDVISRNQPGESIEDLLPALEPGPGTNTTEMVRAMLAELIPDQQTNRSFSSHVDRALHYLEKAVGGKPNLDEAAAAVNISPSRLTHLFTKEVGIPFRNYVLWMRFRRVVDEIAQGSNLTEAAISAGFSDSSHLSRAFRGHFGLSPSALLGMTVATQEWPT